MRASQYTDLKMHFRAGIAMKKTTKFASHHHHNHAFGYLCMSVGVCG